MRGAGHEPSPVHTDNTKDKSEYITKKLCTAYAKLLFACAR